MKKIGVLLLGVCSFFFVTGCEDVFTAFKKDILTCTQEVTEAELYDESGTWKTDYIFEFGADNIVERLYIHQTFLFDDRFLSLKKQEEMIEDTKELCEEENDFYKKESCKIVWTKPNKLGAHREADLSTDEDGEIRGQTKKVIKTELEKNGFSCR